MAFFLLFVFDLILLAHSLNCVGGRGLLVHGNFLRFEALSSRRYRLIKSAESFLTLVVLNPKKNMIRRNVYIPQPYEFQWNNPPWFVYLMPSKNTAVSS
jgi:hypothetical protein